MELLYDQVLNLIILIVAGCVGMITRYLVQFLKKKGIIAKLETHKELAKIVVNAVEQAYNHLDGNGKLELAKAELEKMAKSKGLQITQKEINLLIESAVKEMNKAIKDGLQEK